MSKVIYHSLNITTGNTFYSPQGTLGSIYTVSTSVGINNTSPSNTLHIHSTTGSSNVGLVITDSTTGVGSTSGLTLRKDNTHTGYLWNYSNAPLIIGTNNTQTITISTSGNVGIGTNTITAPLTVNGNISSPNFLVVNPFVNVATWTGGVNSSNFTVGAGTKILTAHFSYWSSGATGGYVTYFDIYTSTGTLVTTLTSGNQYFNVSNCHMSWGYTTKISNTTMPAGTYYLRVRTNGGSSTSDGADYMNVTILNLPF
jgi:hypothetical protein